MIEKDSWSLARHTRDLLCSLVELDIKEHYLCKSNIRYLLQNFPLALCDLKSRYRDRVRLLRRGIVTSVISERRDRAETPDTRALELRPWTRETGHHCCQDQGHQHHHTHVQVGEPFPCYDNNDKTETVMHVGKILDIYTIEFAFDTIDF